MEHDLEAKWSTTRLSLSQTHTPDPHSRPTLQTHPHVLISCFPSCPWRTLRPGSSIISSRNVIQTHMPLAKRTSHVRVYTHSYPLLAHLPQGSPWSQR